jgi:hypothetical protein
MFKLLLKGKTYDVVLNFDEDSKSFFLHTQIFKKLLENKIETQYAIYS